MGSAGKDRYARELNFQETQAQSHRDVASLPVDMEPIESSVRRPHNGLWWCYDRLLEHVAKGDRVLVVGCGYGEDAIRIAKMGARVSAIDLSPQTLEIARRRSEDIHHLDIDFKIGLAESMPYSTGYFDILFCNLVIHHCEIAPTLQEFRRVVRPGGYVLIHEPYMNAALQRIRNSWLVDRVIYSLLSSWIYGPDGLPVSADERKLQQADLKLIADALAEPRVTWFEGFSGRVLPDRLFWAVRFDQWLHRHLSSLSPVIAGSFVVEGRGAGSDLQVAST